MNQIKTGKFIAAMRKEQSLTQRQLAEQLMISDKTISKWETGNGMPEVSLMLPLCAALKINVNELLSGEKLTESNYHEKAEENMMELVREKEENKKKIILSMVVAFTSIVAGVPLVCVAGILEMSTAMRAVLIGIACLVIAIDIGVAIVLDREAGSFECPKCGNRFSPSMKAYIMGPHTITKRKLRCPECGESSYCKHRLTR